MKVDLDEYITEEQKVEIAKSVFRDLCLQVFREDAERIFSNAAYKAVWEEVDKAHDGQTTQKIKDKVLKVIDELTPYSVFREAGIYEKKSSKAQAILEEAVEDNKDKIKEKVDQFVERTPITKGDIFEVLSGSGFSVVVGENTND